MRRRSRSRTFLIAFTIASILGLLAPFVVEADSQLLPGTAILLDQTTTSSSSGGTTATSTMTNTFSPPTYADYKRTGTEPTTTVDPNAYPLPPNPQDYASQCPAGTTATGCYRDTVYDSTANGFVYPAYGFFLKSDNMGQTFHLPANDPTTGGRALTQGTGGGDSFQAVGEKTHKVFFIDLFPDCVTMNVSSDRGQHFNNTAENPAPDQLGCGLNPGFDDRQWVATDESATNGNPAAAPSQNVYVTFNADANLAASTIALARSTHDGAAGTFTTDSVCNILTNNQGIINKSAVTTPGAGDSEKTACPDPADSRLQIAGPVVVDKSPTSPHQHRIYVPFSRCTPGSLGSLASCGAPYQLYIARSDDGGTTWTRYPVCNGTGTASVPCPARTGNPFNIFVEMTIDRAGNLYYTWSETHNPTVTASGSNAADLGGEQDIFYAYSTTGGDSWSPAIDLTQQPGNSAVFPWMVAGDPGQVDLVYYGSNTALNSNVGFVDSNGNPCPDPSTACGGQPNPSVWNVYFSQSNNALNNAPNFKAAQISDHPNHLGQICTNGLNCSGNRNLGDFFTMDIDHLGAANVGWADDNNSRGRSRIKFGRQLAGNSVFKSTPIALQNSWPIYDHSAVDPSGDVITPTGSPGINPACGSMDITKVSASRSGDLLTVSLALNAPPTAASALACSASGSTPYAANGGFWGAEFWASSDPTTAGGAPNDNFYLAYVDDPLSTSPAPQVEAGRFNGSAPQMTSNEANFIENGTPNVVGGTCFTTSGSPATTGPCTITMTASLSVLGIKSGSGLYSVTGLSTYITGGKTRLPQTRFVDGYTSLADSTAAIDYNGTG